MNNKNNIFFFFLIHFSQCNIGREPFPLPPAPAPASLEPESYYEDPQPYDPISINGTSLIEPKGALHTNYPLQLILFFDLVQKWLGYWFLLLLLLSYESEPVVIECSVWAPL